VATKKLFLPEQRKAHAMQPSCDREMCWYFQRLQWKSQHRPWGMAAGSFRSRTANLDRRGWSLALRRPKDYHVYLITVDFRSWSGDEINRGSISLSEAMALGDRHVEMV